MSRAVAHLVMSELKEAEDWGRKSIQAPNANLFCYFVYAAVLGHLGRFEESRTVADDILRIKPDFSLAFVQGMLPTNVDEVRDVILDGLRKAGLPECLGQRPVESPPRCRRAVLSGR